MTKWTVDYLKGGEPKEATGGLPYSDKVTVIPGNTAIDVSKEMIDLLQKRHDKLIKTLSND